MREHLKVALLMLILFNCVLIIGGFQEMLSGLSSGGPQRRSTRSNNSCRFENRGPANCTRVQYLCRGMNHPQCSVKYPASLSTTSPTSKCRVIVRCDYTSDFINNNGICFAVVKAFPSPQLHGVNDSSIAYRYTLKLYNNEIVRSFLPSEDTSINGMQHVKEKIREFASSGLTSFIITTDYSCAQMTPCSNGTNSAV